MTFKSAILISASLPLLAACAASNGLGPVTDYVAATTADGTLEEVIQAGGVTGFVGNSDGTVSEIRVRVDTSDPEAPAFYLSRDGGAEVNYFLSERSAALMLVPIEEPGFALEGELDLVNADGDELSIYLGGLEESDTAFISLYSDADYEWSEGTFGVQTVPENLPTETASYYGGWDAYSETETGYSYAGGEMQLTVDFDNSALIGNTYGYYDSMDFEFEEYSGGDLSGVITGSVSGSEMTATMQVIGEATGTLDMQGAFYGEGADSVSGGIGGTLSTDMGDTTMGGSFGASRDFFDGPCFECIR